MGLVYLIHFERKYQHAQHYIGWCVDNGLKRRLAEHRRGSGSRLMAVIRQAKIGWECVRTWEGVERNFERHLKNKKNAATLCPVCNPKHALTNGLKNTFEAKLQATPSI